MRKLLVAFLSLLLLFSFGLVLAQESQEVEINFFYSKTCVHCAAENEFLGEMQNKYPQLEINRYVFVDNVDLARDFFEKYDISKEKFGAVPLTFINGRFFWGFEKSETEVVLEQAIREELGLEKSATSIVNTTINLPFIGELNPEQYSLPVLTVLMGVLDGFNVCSLGALILILGLVLTLKSRTKIFAYGGIFLLTTAVVYGILIILWYKLFNLLSGYIRTLEIIIGLLGIGGGLYFLKEFLKFRKIGPTCATVEKGTTAKFSERVKQVISQDSTTVIGVLATILLFAAGITIVEFPCSAVVPLAYAGILAKANLAEFSYLIYITLFVLFYLLDELIVFGIAVWKMSVWMQSPKFVTWVTLVESLILFGLGCYYLFGLI